MSNRARDNRFFLYKTVFPFLQKMPTVEDQQKGLVAENGIAICNLSHYIDHHDNRTAHEEISQEYNCGRDGCLAGWYVMLSDRDNRFGPCERNEVAAYDNGDLARHFGIGGHNEGELLFSTRGSGVEESNSTTRKALRARKRQLRTFMEDLGDFEALKETKQRLRQYKVYGF